MFRDEDGGAAHLFRFLAAKLSAPDVRRRLATKALTDASSRLGRLVAEHQPTEDPEAEKRATLDEFLGKIRTAADSTTPQRVGLALRDLLSVDYQDLDPVLTDASGKRRASYLDEQINRWRDIAADKETSWNALGMDDTAIRARIIEYFSNALPKTEILAWMKENQEGVSDGFEQKAHRRFIAVLLTNGLVRGSEPPPLHGAWARGDGESIRKKIGDLVDVQNDEKYDDELMHDMWLAPWIAAVDRLRRTSAPPPVREPGDDEIRELKHLMESAA